MASARRRRGRIAQDLRRSRRQITLAQGIVNASAETIQHRVTMARDAFTNPFGLYHPEFATMVIEKLLAGGEAALLAARHAGPVTHAWTTVWAGLWRAAWGNGAAWLRLIAMTEAAMVAQMRPIHRTVTANAKRLRARR